MLMSVSSLAHAFGCESLVVQNPGDILCAGIERRSVERPLVIDVRVDAKTPMPGNQRIAQLSQSLHATKPN